MFHLRIRKHTSALNRTCDPTTQAAEVSIRRFIETHFRSVPNPKPASITSSSVLCGVPGLPSGLPAVPFHLETQLGYALDPHSADINGPLSRGGLGSTVDGGWLGFRGVGRRKHLDGSKRRRYLTNNERPATDFLHCVFHQLNSGNPPGRYLTFATHPATLRLYVVFTAPASMYHPRS